MQQQELIERAAAAATTAIIKREVMAGMLERLTLLAMKKTVGEKKRRGIYRKYLPVAKPDFHEQPFQQASAH
jgi:hypothetical protein